jgi:hypothetical protein
VCFKLFSIASRHSSARCCPYKRPIDLPRTAPDARSTRTQSCANACADMKYLFEPPTSLENQFAILCNVNLNCPFLQQAAVHFNLFSCNEGSIPDPPLSTQSQSLAPSSSEPSQ